MTANAPQAVPPGVSPGGRRPSWLESAPMRYPNHYVWLVFVSSMDILLTKLILQFASGSELNPIAAAVMEEWGFRGAIVFKFCLMLFVIVVCEVVGRQRDRLARSLATIAVAISSLPVLYSFALLARHVTLAPEEPDLARHAWVEFGQRSFIVAAITILVGVLLVAAIRHWRTRLRG